MSSTLYSVSCLKSRGILLISNEKMAPKKQNIAIMLIGIQIGSYLATTGAKIVSIKPAEMQIPRAVPCTRDLNMRIMEKNALA